MCSRRLTSILAVAALLGAARPAEPDAALVASLRVLAAKDLRVATVAYHLQAASLPICTVRTALPGMIVQDASQYRADVRPAAARALGLADLPAVTAVVAGGPADTAGIHVADALVAVNGVAMTDILPGSTTRAADGDRFTALVARLADAFGHGPVTLTMRRDGRIRTVVLRGTPACASLVQLDLAADRNAGADGHIVTVAQGLLDFVRNDDELALVVGHELAHNMLGHRDVIVADGGRALGRRTEREADHWGLYLCAWAGYDVDAAAPFWRRMARAGKLRSLFPDGLHPAYADRIRNLSREAASIRARRAAGLPLDIAFADARHDA